MSNDLPEGWQEVTLSYIQIETIGGDWGKDVAFDEPDYIAVKVLRGTDLKTWDTDRAKNAVIRKVSLYSLAKRQLALNDIIVEVSGGSQDQPVGRTVLIDSLVLQERLPLICSNFFRKLRLSREVCSPYIHYFLQHSYDLGRFDSLQSKSVGLRNLNFNSFLDETIIPIAPLAEQQRIVLAVDEMLMQVRELRDRLKTFINSLQKYRQDILSAAFSGELTGDWREDEYKTDELPESWELTDLGSIAEVSGGITLNAKRKELPLKLPYLRVANVYANRLELDEIKEVGVSQAEAERTSLQEGDLLLVEGNGSIDQIGRVAMWDGSIDPCLHQNHLIRVRLSDLTTARYVLLYLLSPMGRDKIASQSSTTSGLYNLSLSKTSSLEIPLPPVEEQHEILRRVNYLTKIADRLETKFDQTKAELKSLPKIILAKAFAGELTEPDPNDEPVSVLLKQIRKEREAIMNAPKPEKNKAQRPKNTETKLLEVITNAFAHDSFTFDDLRQKTTKGYETLRDELYELIETDKQVIHQFDSVNKILTFNLIEDASPTN